MKLWPDSRKSLSELSLSLAKNYKERNCELHQTLHRIMHKNFNFLTYFLIFRLISNLFQFSLSVISNVISNSNYAKIQLISNSKLAMSLTFIFNILDNIIYYFR